MSTAVERRWFAAVAETEVCPLCRRQGEQVSHRDYGKGMGLKTAPWMTTYLCSECHRELTDGKTYNRDEKRALMDRAIVETHDQLIRAGVLTLRGK
jgi:transposase-like protein